jgi:CubicO group peptidase (beta-lactamase class C family)
MGLALLMDERRIDYTKPVRDYLSEFQMNDAVATDRVTVRDLLCHHSGLPRDDWIGMPADLSPAQMLAAIRYLELGDDIRSTHQYSNLGYLVAGHGGRTRHQSELERIYTRSIDRQAALDMTFIVEDLATTADPAVPYAMDGDTRLRAKHWPIPATPAGGITASIANFVNWLRLHLDKGVFDGQRLLSPALIQQLQTPRVHAWTSEFPEYGDVHYGLGLRSHWYRGERVVWHSRG